LKIFSGGYTPDPPSTEEEGTGGEGRKGRTEEERRVLGTQLGRRGVVWEREGEEGMRVIQRKGKGMGRGKGGREGRRSKMTCPPPKKKNPGSATGYDVSLRITVNESKQLASSVYDRRTVAA
jgi:hypothetical protein